MHEKENYDISSNELSSTESSGKESISERNYRSDGGGSITQKCGRWSLGNDVATDPPLLADMGLALLPAPEDLSQPSSTPPRNNSQSMKSNILQPTIQNLENHPTMHPSSSNSSDGEFFVFKRRRLDPILGQDKFNLLLDEIVLHVFKWLPKFMLVRCAQVCRRWKRLAFDDSLWKRLDLGGKVLNPGVIGRVILRGVVTFRLAKAEITSPIFCPQLHHLPSQPEVRSRLQHLDLCMASISPEALEELLSVSKNLRKVSLEHCELNLECCKQLSNNPNLDTLNLSMCYNLCEGGVVAVLTKCLKLEALNIAWTNLEASALDAICKSFPSSLRRLNISGCRSTLLDSHIVTLADRCPNLLELDVSDASKITSITISTIVKKFIKIEHLAFARCYGILPAAYQELGRIKSLLFLDIYGMLSESFVNSLKQDLPKININRYLFSSVARPTVGIRRTSIWGLRVRD